MRNDRVEPEAQMISSPESFEKGLSANLERSLLELDDAARHEVVKQKENGCSPLFLTAKFGMLKLMKFLILEECGADLEQVGVYRGEFRDYNPTPLWVAAANPNDRVDVVEALIKFGANVNAACLKWNWTPLMAACARKNIAVVRLLLRHGGDANVPAVDGLTCLNRVIDCPDMMNLLLEQTPALIRVPDDTGMTALHYAARRQDSLLPGLVCLLKWGADPRIKNNDGNDVLCEAALACSAMTVETLADTGHFSMEQIASAYELMGTAFRTRSFNRPELAMEFWSRAVHIRNEFGISKVVNMESRRELFGDVLEFRTNLDLEAATNFDQSVYDILIAERVLGLTHIHSIYLVLMLLCNAHARRDPLCYAMAVRLTNHVLKLSKDVPRNVAELCEFQSTLYADAVSIPILKSQVRMEEVLDTLGIFLSLSSHRQETYGDQMLHYLLQLLYVVWCIGATEQSSDLNKILYKILRRMEPRTSAGETILHLAVSRTKNIQIHPVNYTSWKDVFPNPEVVKLLIDSGADVQTQIPSDGSTPLHMASIKENYNRKVVETLLANGGHIDQKNRIGRTPLALLRAHHPEFRWVKHVSLKCLAARQIKHNLDSSHYHDQISQDLKEFVELH